jgi:hypothetical protein
MVRRRAAGYSLPAAMPRKVILPLTGLLALWPAGTAWGNSPCGCADPTQTTLALDGDVAGFALHPSLAVELRSRQLAGDASPLVEERLQLGVAARLAGWSLAAAVPFAWQQMEAGGTRSGLGDVELRGRAPLLAGELTVHALAGVSLPTSHTFGATTDRLDGLPLGHGATTLLAGAALGYRHEAWSLLLAPAARVVLADDATLLIESNLHAQWQANAGLAVRLNLEAGGPVGGGGHAPGSEGHGGHERALRADPLADHHPSLLAAGPELLFLAGADLLLAGALVVPIYQDGGAADEGVRARLTASLLF